ncbi:transposase [Streptomyces hesseae]|uniref:Transposase n=1 Tax=Streptomyces hesseae TaxID=3075519 RepID=A0ABU2SLS5_9ACTN|nr:transposase [Streptomyces sp. DSM 40473]MDT0449942.1 transposase [Streptomyces sp. DSM 40473]
MHVLSAQCPEFVEVFTGLRPRQFQRLVKAVQRAGGRALDPGRPGRPWSLSLKDRVLLVAVYCRTNLSMPQLAPLFGISTAAVGRIIKRHGPLMTLAPARHRPGSDDVLVVDGTLVPTRDRSVAASSKNHRYSTNVQVLIKAETKLVLAVGRPMPGNHNDCIAFADSGIKAACGNATVIADGGYRGTGLLIPHRRQAGQERLEPWKEEHNASHRRVRARVEHVFARMKNWKILRDCRLKGDGVYWAVSGVARMHNLALAGWPVVRAGNRPAVV